jgi:hypothetical protein
LSRPQTVCSERRSLTASAAPAKRWNNGSGSEIEEGQSDGRVQARAKIFQKGVVNGEFASLEFYLINQCGWSRKPEVQVTTNVIQNTGSSRSPEQTKAHLVELQKAVLEECRRQSPELFLPPGR